MWIERIEKIKKINKLGRFLKNEKNRIKMYTGTLPLIIGFEKLPALHVLYDLSFLFCRI